MIPIPGFKEIENRAYSRKDVKERAVLGCRSGRVACRIENISTGGCYISVRSDDLEIGDTVEITILSKDTVLYGKIIWIRLGEIGVQFDYMAPPEPA